MNAKGGRIGTLQWILSTSIGRKIFWKMLARQNIFNTHIPQKKGEAISFKSISLFMFFRSQSSERILGKRRI